MTRPAPEEGTPPMPEQPDRSEQRQVRPERSEGPNEAALSGASPAAPNEGAPGEGSSKESVPGNEGPGKDASADTPGAGTAAESASAEPAADAVAPEGEPVAESVPGQAGRGGEPTALDGPLNAAKPGKPVAAPKTAAPETSLPETVVLKAAPRAVPPVPHIFDVTPEGHDDLDGLSVDEAALRSLMHQAVEGLSASPDALDHLRRAVPLRRQRRRQAAVGAVAAVLLAGLAVPAVIRAADTSDRTNAAPAGLSSSAGAASPSGDRARTSGAEPPRTAATSGGATSKPVAGVGPTGGPTPSGTGQAVPDCASTQLGDGTSSAGSPDADGRVYGWFRVANVSTSPCAVPGPGLVTAIPQGTGTPGSIQVVAHTAGDAATGLPVPDSIGPVVLSPGQDYEVAFAWVPTAGGCTDGDPTTPPASPTATPTETATGGTDAGTGTDSNPGSTGLAPTHDTSTTAAPPSAIELDHTPAAGAPVVPGPVIPNACSGTVYTTAAIPAPVDAPAS